jgi:hypothetical protein
LRSFSDVKSYVLDAHEIPREIGFRGSNAMSNTYCPVGTFFGMVKVTLRIATKNND